MTPRWAARLLFLIGLFAGAAAWTPPASAVELPRPAPAGPAMWRLQTGTATVYFLGSFHILPPDVQWHDERVAAAMRDAQGVVFEVNLNDMEKPEVARMIVSRASLPKGMTLRDVLSKDTYGRLSAMAGTLGMRDGVLDRAQPWFAATGLLVGYMAKSGANPGDGVDSQLTREATAAGKRIIPLETVAQQFDMLETLSEQDPDFLVMDTIRFIEDPQGLLARMIDAWKSGDTDTVDAVMREDMNKYEGVYDRFITSRNAAWAPKIEALIRKGGTYFVVVGAGHLVGEGSVIALLKAKGYEIERY